jgi:hypothetical protein
MLMNPRRICKSVILKIGNNKTKLGTVLIKKIVVTFSSGMETLGQFSMFLSPTWLSSSGWRRVQEAPPARYMFLST